MVDIVVTSTLEKVPWVATIGTSALAGWGRVLVPMLCQPPSTVPCWIGPHMGRAGVENGRRREAGPSSSPRHTYSQVALWL